ncbi:MAG: rhodanese-like domain-containing protein, partial [Deltaproteobacteria bacterium]|nr:rhodanese-like domain-containing protein [Deltaproteobacteria bacterium]
MFADGFPAWKNDPGTYTAVEVSHLKSKLESGSDMVVIDSRPKRAKYDKGHIPGAISIPDRKF